MTFDLDRYLEILERTPAVLELLLSGLSPEWIAGTEGFGTWSPYDVVGHLIHGERTDWIALDLILGDGADKTFNRWIGTRSFTTALAGRSASCFDFADARQTNLACVRALRLTGPDLDRTGIHPKFGTVTARQLLST